MDLSIVIRVGLIIALLAFSAFFSGSEASLFSLGKWRLKQLEEKGHPQASGISSLLAQPRRLIISLLIGNELVNVAVSALSASVFISLLGDSSKWLSIAVITPLLLIVGEITPKLIAVKSPVRFSSWVARPLGLFVCLVAPLRWVFKGVSEVIISLLGVSVTAQANIIREDEFRTLVDVGEKEGVLEASERELIENVFEFGDTTVADLMTPRVDIFSLSSDLTLEDILEEIQHHPFSRIPIYQGNREDNIIGILYAKDLLNLEKSRNQWGDKDNLQRFLRPPYFIPWSKKALELFQDFQKKKVHLAIVVDEYGGIVGLITMEDLLQTLFGEIEDERGFSEPLFESLAEDTFLVSARLPIEEFNKTVGARLPNDQQETMGGLVFSLFGRLPQAGETISLDEFTFVLQEIDGTQIKKVLVKRGG